MGRARHVDAALVRILQSSSSQRKRLHYNHNCKDGGIELVLIPKDLTAGDLVLPHDVQYLTNQDISYGTHISLSLVWQMYSTGLATTEEDAENTSLV